MKEKLTGIILNVRKYNDSNNIVTVYTREKGRLSFISPNGSGKGGNARRARLQPLALIETEATLKSGAELHRLPSVTTPEVWKDIYFHPAKRAQSLFVSEFLYRLLHATMADPSLFDFLVNSLRLLDRLENGVADFHIPFLVSLLSFSGIQPDVSNYKEGYAFDFASGSFVPEFETQGPALKNQEAQGVVFVSRINFSNMKNLRLSSENRRRILYGLLNYYSYHFPGLATLKSPEILREIFDQ